MLFKRWKPGNADQGVRPELGEANPSWTGISYTHASTSADGQQVTN